MNQRVHAWLAVRAVALLEDTGEAEGLVKLLSPHVKSTFIGTWLPDLNDSKKGFGKIDNHVLKMEVFEGPLKERFVIKKDKLLKLLGRERRMATELLQSDNHVLDDEWWGTPFKADPDPGKHLANRAMAFSEAIIDLLLLGDKQLDRLVPGQIDFVEDLDRKALTRRQQVATYFFMLSHFIADACMPCHTDARALSSYSDGKIHKELERRWSRRIGTYFDKDKLAENKPTSSAILRESREISDRLQVDFDAVVPDLYSRDVWSEVLFVCRCSYAVANLIVPPNDSPRGGAEHKSLKELFPGDNGEIRLKEFDAAILHDAVLNIAIVWKHIWGRFCR
ncbi:MAG: hypothetical protein JSW34_09885 [Candidatus Zixiibacteriota bacterium]|nr:MAG: hypothetical protein JSW34_09885 [candidate division Zixibacteria bacterium]